MWLGQQVQEKGERSVFNLVRVNKLYKAPELREITFEWRKIDNQTSKYINYMSNC